MQFDWKKIGIIVLLFIAVGFFAFSIYYFFWQPILGPAPGKEVATTTTGGLPIAGTSGSRTTTTGPAGLPIAGGVATSTATTGGLTSPTAAASKTNILVSVPTRFSSVTSDGKIIYYNSQDGKFYTVDANGHIVALSDRVFYNVSNAVFSHGGTQAVIQYPDGSNTIFDFTTGKQTTLPKHWQDFEFSATDQKIAFKNIGLDTANRFLVTANTDGTNVKIIEEIGENADLVQTNWSPDNQVVATYNTSVNASQSEIFFIGQNNENFKSLLVEGRDFRGLWSPDSSKMLYSVYDPNNGYRPQLWISDASGNNIGNNRQKINLNTWADNCTFAGNNYALCSAPKTMPYGAGLERGITSGIADQLWAINLQTGQVSLIDQDLNSISKVMYLESSPNSVFISNESDNKIYQINLTAK